ncbi:MAG: LegC family aminotransferase [Flavobacteriales bacterium]|jgi:perosamine synthetase|nr:LegC family aminotransferase [Flavobacteriales bacterium]
MFDDVVDFVRSIYGKEGVIPLHHPLFIGNEKQYINECIDSTYVSSVGKFVDKFEEKIAEYTGSNYAVATTNGTSALHIAFLLSDVIEDDEVITQPLTFIATCNAISYCGANPIFIDVDKETMGLSPDSLNSFLSEHAVVKNNQCLNKTTGKIIKVCVPMHTLGHSCRISEIKEICDKYKIILIEDAAESLGSFYNGKHTGTYGSLGVLSFNGNKIITGGGGGCIITDDPVLAKKAKHLTTTAKVPHKWKYSHDMIGYNYRMPNLNAALLTSQLENLISFLSSKRNIAIAYKEFFKNKPYRFIEEPVNSKSNYWLNAIIFKDKEERDLFLHETNSKGVMTRPMWTLMNKLSMFQESQCGELSNAEWLEERVANIPSSMLIHPDKPY